MKKIILILFVSLNLISGQEIMLSLEESIELGLKNSKLLKISESKIKQAKAKYSEISSLQFPKISLNAKYSRLSDVDPFQVSLPMLPDPVTIQESYLNNYFFNLSLEQPIFTGFRISSLKTSSEHLIRADEITNKRERLKISVEIEQAFWAYYTTLQINKLIEENLRTLKSHLNNTKTFLDNGLVTQNDYLKIKVNVAQAELKLLEANNNAEIALAAFNKSIGLPLDSETNISVPKIESKINVDKIEHLITYAHKNREELLVSSLQVKALDNNISAAQSEWYPQLYAFANLYYNNPNQRHLPLKDEFNDSWDVGVAMKWDLWNWGGTSAKIEQAHQKYLQAENSQNLLRDKIELEVFQNYTKVNNSIKKIEICKVQLEAAIENYRITDKKYLQQLSTSTELLDSETELLKAKTDLVNTKVEYRINTLLLNQSIGKQSD